MNLFVKGWEGRTITLGEIYKFNQDTKIKRLREVIAVRTGRDPKELLLLYVAKQLDE